MLLVGYLDLVDEVQSWCDNAGTHCNTSIGGWTDVAGELEQYSDGELSSIVLVGHSHPAYHGVKVSDDGVILRADQIPDSTAALIDEKLKPDAPLVMFGCYIAQDEHGSAESLQEAADKIQHPVIGNVAVPWPNSGQGMGLWLIFYPQ